MKLGVAGIIPYVRDKVLEASEFETRARIELARNAPAHLTVVEYDVLHSLY